MGVSIGASPAYEAPSTELHSIATLRSGGMARTTTRRHVFIIWITPSHVSRSFVTQSYTASWPMIGRHARTLMQWPESLMLRR